MNNLGNCLHKSVTGRADPEDSWDRADGHIAVIGVAFGDDILEIAEVLEVETVACFLDEPLNDKIGNMFKT